MNSHEPQQPEVDRTGSELVESEPKTPWSEPKLAFVEPQVKKHGDVVELTGEGFFGTFTP